jgi:hypothetical protein
MFTCCKRSGLAAQLGADECRHVAAGSRHRCLGLEVRQDFGFRGAGADAFDVNAPGAWGVMPGLQERDSLRVESVATRRDAGM